MTELREAHNDIKFFISCDVPEVQAQIHKAFPNSIGQDGKGTYNSSQGVVSGVVDLYLLASSNYMLVPYWSSFPAMAWELAERKVVMEDSRTMWQNVDITDVRLADDPLRPSYR
ncbi:hypothetical protein [Arthrobacter sp. H16F315]|uniref:hypothetical protein n=1 Tax=Arthrobacter sp. H16F315 TaxID=2955314 RepID=UPI00209740F6|nr:hypothetical protein [Arthrobacter sp. H16F315]MDD1477214.1 hypothetical protein [Arthrobacter sp. H16F315]